jgi:hypothetical protein
LKPHSSEPPGARTLQCQVLRCQWRASRSFVIHDDIWGMAEVMTCANHQAALEAGESYSYNHTDNVIYMGQDLV